LLVEAALLTELLSYYFAAEPLLLVVPMIEILQADPL